MTIAKSHALTPEEQQLEKAREQIFQRVNLDLFIAPKILKGRMHKHTGDLFIYAKYKGRLH